MKSFLQPIGEERRVAQDFAIVVIGVRRRVSKGVEDGRKPPALGKGRKAVSGVARLQGLEGLGIAGPSDTLGSPWPTLAIRQCRHRYCHRRRHCRRHCPAA
jgi:hypothetical protein